MKNRHLASSSLLFFTFALSISAYAQNLTVRDIMAEPSIAGQRVEGEKLSPDGTKVVYLWNADGKLPRDLYLVSTSGGTPQIILRSMDLPKPSATPQPENKLDYGVEVRDEFVKVRENALGGFEWSQDSRKLVFTFGGDLFVLTLGSSSDPTGNRQWVNYEATLLRRANLVTQFIGILEKAGINESELVSLVIASVEKLRVAINESPSEGSKSEIQRQRILREDEQVANALNRLTSLPESYPILRSDSAFEKLVDELSGTKNRIHVAKIDYLDAKTVVKRYTKTQTPESGARFLDNERILFSQSGHWFVLNTVDATLTQLTREGDPAKFISVGGVVPNKQGSMIAYVVSDNSKQKQLVVPNFIPEYVTGGGPRRGWTEQKVFVTPADGSRDTPFEIKLPKHEGVSLFRRMVWTADGRSLIVDRNDKDTKRRQLFYIHNVASKDEQTILVTEETDDKWQAPLSTIFEPHPTRPGELFFGSERDGHNHLYLAKLEAETRPVGSVPDASARVQEGSPGLTEKVTIKQLSKGNWQVEWAKWLPNDRNERIVFLSTQQGTAIREFYTVNFESKISLFFGQVENSAGIKESPQLAEHSNFLLFSFSRWNQPAELYGVGYYEEVDLAGPRYAQRLTKTIPVTFSQRAGYATVLDSLVKPTRPVGEFNWNEPKFIDIPSRDGKVIKSKIYLPAGHDAKKKYPMAIFVHGAGYLQNTINGWNNYYREFMFNQLLTQKGYVVLDIDYRGSAGYGRDWRTDVYDFLGGKDFEDHIDGIDFMVKNYGVDQKRIGVYGGSYGGFMAGMLAMRAPERIAAAAALRPVFDWKNYYAANPQYTAQRLGFPDKNPEAYKRSSPISYAEKLERPLLILHGMSDDNVHVQDSVQLMEKLIRLGKTQYFEAMLYPSENHGFVRPESWADEYERILAFFEKYLK